MGTFAPQGSRACAPCPAGRFGSATGLSSPDCSGACAALPGFSCPAGTQAAGGVRCPTGLTSTGGAGQCDAACTALPGGVFHISTREYTGPVTATCRLEGLEGTNVCGALVTSYDGVDYYAHVPLKTSGNYVACDV
jgi:hypothetical protein